MSDTMEDLKRGEFDSKRREILRNMNFRELGELLPSESQKLYHEEDWDKEELIDVIINNCFDKQINDEVR